MLVLSNWQSVVHGQGAIKQICIRGSFIESWECLDNCWCRTQAWSETYKETENCLKVDFPAQRYAKFPRIQRGQILAWLGSHTSTKGGPVGTSDDGIRGDPSRLRVVGLTELALCEPVA